MARRRTRIVTRLFLRVAVLSWLIPGPVLPGVLRAAEQATGMERRPMTPEDYYSFRFISNLEISPGGEEVLFVVSDVAQDRRRRDRSIWVVPTDGSAPARQLTSGSGDGSPAWSPDGARIAFLRRGPESKSGGDTQSSQIFVLRRDAGEALQVSYVKGGVGGMQWLPDGRRMLLTLSGPRPADADQGEKKEPRADVDVVRDAVYKSNGRGYLDERRSHLFLFDVENGEMRQLTDGEKWTESGATLSPDGRTLAFASDRTGEQFEGGWTSAVWSVDLAAGGEGVPTPVSLTRQDFSHRAPKFSPDGKTLAYLRTDSPYDQAGIFLQEPVAGAVPRKIGAAVDRSPGAIQWTPDGSHLLFIADDRGSSRLFRIDAVSGEFSRLFDAEHSVGDLSIARRSSLMAFTLENEEWLPEVHVAALDGSGLRQLTRLNEQILAPLARGTLEEIWFDNDGGGKSQGFLLRPTIPVREGKVPLVLDIKGGPGGMWGHQWFHEFQMLAGRGWAVAFVNYRGSTGYGAAHQDAVRLDYGGVDYRDNMKLVDTLLEQHDWIDRDRLYVTGGSHGGFLTNWIVSQTTRFRAAVTQRSVSSWVSEAGTQQYPPRRMQDEFGGSLWNNWDLYWDRSPLKYANQVKTPTLILHSDQDMICPLGQAEEWFYALKTHGVDTEMVIFRGENHNLSRNGTPVNLVERLKRIMEWFERHGG